MTESESKNCSIPKDSNIEGIRQKVAISNKQIGKAKHRILLQQTQIDYTLRIIRKQTQYSTSTEKTSIIL